MEITIMIICIAMTALLIAAYILVIGAGRSDREEEREISERIDPVAILKPNFAIGPVSEMDEERDERLREEAEKEYIIPNPEYAEPETDLRQLEIYLENAKNPELPRCIRMVSGIFLRQYESLGFMEELMKKLEPIESESVLDAMEMGRNPQLYMERHGECLSRCKNEVCPFCKKEDSGENGEKSGKMMISIAGMSCLVAFSAKEALAIGNGMSGITQATSEVTSYFNPITKLMYAIGAIVGLIGAVRVYSKFSSGDPDTTKVAATWFGACIFLVIAATVLSGFFF